jgi:hypothetical protein
MGAPGNQALTFSAALAIFFPTPLKKFFSALSVHILRLALLSGYNHHPIDSRIPEGEPFT